MSRTYSHIPHRVVDMRYGEVHHDPRTHLHGEECRVAPLKAHWRYQQSRHSLYGHRNKCKKIIQDYVSICTHTKYFSINSSLEYSSLRRSNVVRCDMRLSENGITWKKFGKDYNFYGCYHTHHRKDVKISVYDEEKVIFSHEVIHYSRDESIACSCDDAPAYTCFVQMSSKDINGYGKAPRIYRNPRSECWMHDNFNCGCTDDTNVVKGSLKRAVKTLNTIGLSEMDEFFWDEWSD